MAGALEDAFRKYDQKQSFSEARRQREAVERGENRKKFNALVADFLVRMRALGFPGTTERSFERGAFRRAERVDAWFLIYELGDARRGFLLTTDGRIPRSDRPERGESHFVPYGQFDEDLSERALERLAQSMVEIIRAHNPKG